jgi:transposase
MKRIPKQEYTAEFKEQAVKHAQAAGIVVAARELGLVEQTLRNWVKAAEAGKLVGAGAKPVTPEQMELSRLRAENARLKMHVDILKKATAYFVAPEKFISGTSERAAAQDRRCAQG